MNPGMDWVNIICRDFVGWNVESREKVEAHFFFFFYVGPMWQCQSELGIGPLSSSPYIN